MIKNFFIGIDIGGSKVHFGLIDKNLDILNDKKVLLIKTGCIEKDLDFILSDLKKFLNENSLKNEDLEHIGICVPSVLDKKRESVLWTPNIEGWENYNIKRYFLKEMGINTSISHDIKAAALGEFEKVYRGKVKNMVFISIGTGIGAGIIINEKIFYGENNLSGSIGWFINSRNEIYKERKIKNSGWLETNSSGIYFNRILNKFKDIPNDYSFPKEILKLYKNGDKKAIFLINNMMDCLGIAISNILSLLDINTIVIGGSIGLDLDVFFDYLSKIIKKDCNPYTSRNIKISLSKIKNAALIGAVVDRF